MRSLRPPAALSALAPKPAALVGLPTAPSRSNCSFCSQLSLENRQPGRSTRQQPRVTSPTGQGVTEQVLRNNKTVDCRWCLSKSAGSLDTASAEVVPLDLLPKPWSRATLSILKGNDGNIRAVDSIQVQAGAPEGRRDVLPLVGSYDFPHVDVPRRAHSLQERDQVQQRRVVRLQLPLAHLRRAAPACHMTLRKPHKGRHAAGSLDAAAGRGAVGAKR